MLKRMPGAEQAEVAREWTAELTPAEEPAACARSRLRLAAKGSCRRWRPRWRWPPGCAPAALEAEELPVADGGEGTAEVFAAALGGEWRQVAASDPLGRARARRAFSSSRTGRRSSRPRRRSASPARGGRARSACVRRAVGSASSCSRAAAEASGPILVGLGDSATVDGGAGLREVVGDALAGRELRALCDVRNPLLGERGAARAFGPQKGASPEQVEELEARLAGDGRASTLRGPARSRRRGWPRRRDRLARRRARLRARSSSSSGSASARSQRGADLVVTGEGTIDRSSCEGKAVGEVVRICGEEGVRCVVFGGRVDEALPGVEMHALSGDPERAADDLVELGERLAGALLGRRVASSPSSGASSRRGRRSARPAA